MSYFAEPNHIEYDAWFDENIDPLDLVNYSNEKEFSDSVHELSLIHISEPTRL